jgi:hypothetical protein
MARKAKTRRRGRRPGRPPQKNEAVNHPSHYQGGIECIDAVEQVTDTYSLGSLASNLGEVIKYIWRAPLKGNMLEDLKKARWYLDRTIARIEKFRVQD